MTTRSGRRYQPVTHSRIQEDEEDYPDFIDGWDNMPIQESYFRHQFYQRRYRERDIAHRHRIADDESDSEDVRAYSRRPSHR